MSFLAVSDDELGGPLGDTATCPNCGQQHEVEYGESINYAADGSEVRTPTNTVAFVVCSENQGLYLVGIDGKTIKLGRAA